MVGVNEERAGADQSVRLSVVLEPVIFLSKAGAFEWMVRARRARCDFLLPRGTDGRRTRSTPRLQSKCASTSYKMCRLA